MPLAPGGPTDVAARVMAEPLSRIWGQQVVIENRPGGGTNIAAELVAQVARPTAIRSSTPRPRWRWRPASTRTLGYDPVTDLAPVANLFTFPYYMFVPNSSPAKTVQEFIAYAKANPGKLTMASPGTGSAPHLAIELFKTMAGLNMIHVPYRGAGPVLNDLIPGRVDVYIASGSLLENVRAGQIRGLGVTGLKPRSRGARPAADRRRGAGLRGDVVAGDVRRGQDAARDHQGDQCRGARRAHRSRGQGQGRADRLCARALDARKSLPRCSRSKSPNGPP